MSVKTYDPKEVQVIVGGAILTGFSDGSFVEVERDEDAFTKHVGADGEVSRAKSNNRSGSVTVRLAQTSPSNDILQGYAVLDELSNSGVVPLMVKDLGGATLCEAAEAWVRKPANVEMGKEISDREWMLDCAQLLMFVGGQTIPAA